ncbi:hypothetical protein Hanom_Chr17g01574761 [Helianthus anomalus]
MDEVKKTLSLKVSCIYFSHHHFLICEMEAASLSLGIEVRFAYISPSSNPIDSFAISDAINQFNWQEVESDGFCSCKCRILEVVEIMKTQNDPKALAKVKCKIYFICNYFHSHLPYHGWKYSRDNASTIVNRYRLKREPKYNMAGYIPFSFKDLKVCKYEFDLDTNLARQDMIKVMSIIHSRKTPTFLKLGAATITFYCKICSCFGIDYSRLEGASKDDVLI